MTAIVLSDRMRSVSSVEAAADLTASMLPHFRAWAPRIAKDYQRTAVADHDDVVGVCAETTFHLLTDKRPTAHVDNWYSYVYGSCRHQVLAHFESGAVAPMSGMTQLLRNERTTAAERVGEDQGTHLSVATLLDDDEPVLEHQDLVISEVEGRELVQMVIEACYDEDEQLGEVADCWIGDLYSEPPVVNSGADIGRQVGVSNQRALALLTRVRRIAQTVCEDELGLTGLF